MTRGNTAPTAVARKVPLVLALEGTPQIDTDIELLTTFYRLGIRVAALAHFGRTALADGSGEDAAGSRLTRAGVAAVQEMERIGMLLDISHLGLAGVDHVLELATRPIIATHSSARALRDHHRNLPDEHLAGVAASGGVVCVNFFAGYLTQIDGATVGDLVDHIEHAVNIAGIDHVGIGPDFALEVFDTKFPTTDPLIVEGVNVRRCIPGLEGPSGLPLLTEALVLRGFPDDHITAILGGNVLRLFRDTLALAPRC
ncbi:MAG: dipeptidase [Mycobacteriales bacterium]